jgi:anti-sigma factor RsiW
MSRSTDPRGPAGKHEPGSPACRELFEKLSDYLDGELDPALCSAIEVHLGDCPPCQDFLRSLERTVALVRRLPAEPLPAEAKRELIEAAARLLKARGGKGPG